MHIQPPVGWTRTQASAEALKGTQPADNHHRICDSGQQRRAVGWFVVSCRSGRESCWGREHTDNKHKANVVTEAVPHAVALVLENRISEAPALLAAGGSVGSSSSPMSS